MALSTINSFPINTVFEFANENEHGLCPQLCGSIHEDLVDCDRNTPVSERAIRYALSIAEGGVNYANIGTGAGIYSENDDITAKYSTLSAD